MTRALLSAFVLLLLGPASQLRAQITSNLRSASDAEPYRPQITDFVNRQIANLTSADATPGVISSARQSLISQVTASSSPSTSFLDVYADVVDKSLANLLKNSSIPVRLNAAVIAAEVAKKAGNSRLARITDQLLNDKCEAIVIWGMKSAKYVLPAQLLEPAVMRKPELSSSILQAVKKNSGSGAVMEEAYAAATLATTSNLRDVPTAAVRDAIAAVLNLLSYRASLYTTDSPASPDSDNEAVIFLTRSKVWNIETAKQQADTMMQMDAIVDGIARIITQNPPPPNRDELVQQMRQTGRAFQVLADFKTSNSLKQAASDIAEMGAGASNTVVATRVAALDAAVKSTIAGPNGSISTGVSGTSLNLPR